MKAIAKTNNYKGLDLLDIEEPRDIGDNEVLVEVDYVSICGTDLHIYNWDGWAEKRIKLPRILGHEGTGIVIETGKNVKLTPGQRISFESHIP
ncbi:MAG: alcohol dehydrogenase catalytic domain-containing protein, partial [bacterium]